MNREKILECLDNIKNIRLIQKEDDAYMADIIRTNLEHSHLDIPGTAYFDPELSHLSRYYDIQKDKCIYMVAVGTDHQIVGGGGIAEFNGFANCAEIQKLYVAMQDQGKGYGKMILHALEKCAEVAGFDRLYLETHTNLDVAMHMYEKYGFTEIARPASVVHSTMNRFYVKEL